MALEIFRLVGSIFVDNDAADKSISQTDSKAQKIGQTLLNGVATAAKWGAALAAGAATAVAGVTKLATNAAATADNIDKMSAKIGLSRTGFQEWSYVLGQNGMDVDKLQTGLKTLVTQMTAADQGTAKSVEAFEALGLSIYDDTGALKDQETMMNEVLYALADMGEGTERAALANQLFGRSGTELAPMLNTGSDSMRELTQRAHDLGLILGDEAVDAGVKLGDTMDDLKQSFGAIVTRLGASFFPILQQAIEYLIGYMPQISTIFDKLAPVLMDMMDALLPILIEMVEVLLPPLMDVLEALLPILQPIFQQVLLPLVQYVLAPAVGFIAEILEALPGVFEILVDGCEVAWGKIKDFFNNFKNGAVDAWNKVKNTFNGIADFFSGLWDKIKSTFKNLGTAVGDAIGGAFKSVINGVLTTVESTVNKAIGFINSAIGVINKIPGVSIGNVKTVSLPRLERGGVLSKGQVGILEGTGAEAVVPLENNRAWTQAVARDMESAMGGQRTEQLLSAILDKLDALAGMGVYLDTGKLVGEIADPLDRVYGRNNLRRVRG